MRKLMSVLWICVVLQSVVPAQAATTRDEVMSVKLDELIKKATEPLDNRLKNTRLPAMFQAVNEHLGRPNVDKEQLVKELQALSGELTRFTDDWGSVTDPLFSAADQIGATIAKVRSLLARAGTGEPNPEVKARLAHYDARLRHMARMIQSETDPERQAKLKIMFKNILEIRDLVEKFGTLNLNKAHEAVYAKTLQALVSLENQFSLATFEAEKARVILLAQRDFVQDYVDILSGVIEAEKLAEILGKMNQAGRGLPGIHTNIRGITDEVEKFQTGMSRLVDKVAENIQADTDRMSEGRIAPMDEKSVDEAIRRYGQSAN